uniref:hypothetical protein n=1 Tax=Natronorubrum sulfidifaciens TaxID=388259 RepID=UPI0019D35E02|nr:hypothetical protein [Natronorubrum sulfidifaciens]
MDFGISLQNRPIVKRAGRVRLHRAIVELVGPPRQVRVTVCPYAKHTDNGPVGILPPLAHTIEIIELGERYLKGDLDADTLEPDET